jgi:phosphate transport system ATP-binding protein
MIEIEDTQERAARRTAPVIASVQQPEAEPAERSAPPPHHAPRPAPHAAAKLVPIQAPATSEAEPEPAPTKQLAVAPVIHPEVDAALPVMSVDRFSLHYGKRQALFSIDMKIPAGKVTAMIGPSGCGKSTLLRSCNRLNDLIDHVKIDGNISIDGQPIYASNIDVIALRKRVGMVFQKPNPFPMSIFENVVYALRIGGEKRKSVLMEACEKALRASALWDEVHNRLHDGALGLSGGQQQRLCIARAIAADPEVLLMDEPCSALDPIATAKVEDLIHSLRGNYTILIVTHNMQQAARVSDFTSFMYLGKLIEYGPTPTIFGVPRHPQTEAYVSGRFG